MSKKAKKAGNTSKEVKAAPCWTEENQERLAEALFQFQCIEDVKERFGAISTFVGGRKSAKDCAEFARENEASLTALWRKIENERRVEEEKQRWESVLAEQERNKMATERERNAVRAQQREEQERRREEKEHEQREAEEKRHREEREAYMKKAAADRERQKRMQEDKAAQAVRAAREQLEKKEQAKLEAKEKIRKAKEDRLKRQQMEVMGNIQAAKRTEIAEERDAVERAHYGLETTSSASTKSMTQHLERCSIQELRGGDASSSSTANIQNLIRQGAAPAASSSSSSTQGAHSSSSKAANIDHAVSDRFAGKVVNPDGGRFMVYMKDGAAAASSGGASCSSTARSPKQAGGKKAPPRGNGQHLFNPLPRAASNEQQMNTARDHDGDDFVSCGEDEDTPRASRTSGKQNQAETLPVTVSKAAASRRAGARAALIGAQASSRGPGGRAVASSMYPRKYSAPSASDDNSDSSYVSEEESQMSDADNDLADQRNVLASRKQMKYNNVASTSSSSNGQSKKSIDQRKLEDDKMSVEDEADDHAPQASNRTISDDEDEGLTCGLCADQHEANSHGFWAQHRCGHSSVCAVCTLKFRFLMKKAQCPLCITDQPTFVLTRTPLSSWDQCKIVHEDGDDPWSSDGRFRWVQELKCFAHVQEEQDLKAVETFKRMATWDSCPMPKCRWHGRGNTREDLSKHLQRDHKHAQLQYCHICVEHQNEFPLLMPRYDVTKGELVAHCNSMHEKCVFCPVEKTGYFYNKQEALKHLRDSHEKCITCDKAGKSACWFQNFEELWYHHESTHYVCREEYCYNLKACCFATQYDLESHNHLMHKGPKATPTVANGGLPSSAASGTPMTGARGGPTLDVDFPSLGAAAGTSASSVAEGSTSSTSGRGGIRTGGRGPPLGGGGSVAPPPPARSVGVPKPSRSVPIERQGWQTIPGRGAASTAGGASSSSSWAVPPPGGGGGVGAGGPSQQQTNKAKQKKKQDKKALQNMAFKRA
ncbi:unnamed protein product [Amoebophrya sp. A25]|nr:unnamed protein product [Amoebophrya sp. A25]|eukprot:GSA25T00014032001.1